MQELGCPFLAAAEFLDECGSAAQQGSCALKLFIGTVDAGEQTARIEGSQLVGIDRIVLHAIAAPAGNRRGRDHVAANAELPQQPKEDEAAGRRLVAAARLTEVFADAADELPNRRRLVLEPLLEENVGGGRVIDAGRDRIFVNVKTNVNTYIRRSRTVLFHGTVPLGVRDFIVKDDTIRS